MEQLIAQLQAYSSEYREEHVARVYMLHLAQHVENPLNRKTFSPGHFTASPFIITPDYSKVLYLHHATFNRWQQPGGHADDDANLLRVGLREVEEELGLKQGDYTLYNNGEIFDLDCHHIPYNAKKDEAEHIHFDVRFLLICPEREIVSPEGLQTKWWPIAEAMQLQPVEAGRLRVLQKIQNLGQNA